MTVQHSALTGTSLHYTKIRTNAGAPGSAPLWIGDVLFDTVNNAVYVATGTAAISDWKLSAKASLQDNLFTIYDNSDVTKTFQFEASSIGTGTNRTLTVPDLNGILALTTGAQTLSNKTLDNTTVLTIQDANLTLQDNADNTKIAKLELSGITTGTTRTYTLPDASTTLTGTTDTATVSNKINNNTNTYVAKDTNFTLQDDGDTTKQAQFQLSGLTTATTRTYSLPDATTTIVGIDVAQILTNKDIDGGTAANTRRITLPKDVKANLDALTRKQGTVVFASDQNKAYVDNGTSLVAIGSGSSGLYSTIDFEDNSTGGISTYADAAASTPTDGTGGAPSSTFTVNASSPLRGTYDGLFTKSAANRQGEGFSLPITLSNADLGKTIQVIFDIKTSANFVSGDMVFYVYDVTNSTLITPSQTILPTGTSSQYSVAFQATTGTSYRLIWHVATTSALAYTVEVDQISYTSVVRPVVAGVGDWITGWVPTISAGAGVATAISGRYKRIGDWNEYEVTFTSATAAASSVSISLPTGHVIDTTKILINSAAGSAGENVGTYSGSVSNSSGAIIANTSTSTTLVYLSGVYGSTALIAANGTANIGNSNQISCYFRLPITNQSSNITLASTSGAIEYQSNSSSTDADDTTSFVAGASGSVGILNTTALSTGRKKRVQFSTPIQPTDRIVIEFSSANGAAPWTPAIGYDTGVTAYQVTSFYNYGAAAAQTQGIGYKPVAGSNTQLDISFGSSMNAFGGAAPWNANFPTGTRWRVAKYSAIGGAELAPATVTTQGTVGYSQWTSAGYVVGNFTGLGTVASVNSKMRREGDSLRLNVSFTSGTGTAVLAKLILPTVNGTTLTIDTTKINPNAGAGTSLHLAGTGATNGIVASQNSWTVLLDSSDNTSMYFSSVGSTTWRSTVAQNGNVILSSGSDFISFTALIPILGWN
jgi:hypothetical protein